MGSLSTPQNARDGNPFGSMEMARTLAFLFVAGGSTVLIGLATGHNAQTRVAGVAAIAVAALVAGPVLLAVGRRLSRTGVAAFLVLGTTVITGVIYFDGPSSVYAAFYPWVGAEAFLFLSRRGIALQIAYMAASYALVLTTGHITSGTAPQRLIVVIGATVTLGVLVGYLRAQLVAVFERLHAVARTDELTGVPNRRAFEERFEQELARAAREAQPLSVVMGDLDGFKLVNDQLGHPAGDAALRRAAASLEQGKRLTDVVARVGGEEFAVLLPSTAPDQAGEVAERLRVALRECFAGDEVPLSISFGVATFPVHAAEGPGVLRAADQAAYTAKTLGRDRTVIYDPSATDALDETRRRAAEGNDMQLATLVGLAEALDIRDTGTGEHSRTVGRLAAIMARRMGMAGAHVERVELAGLLHDVGKIGISDGVLTKPGPLDDDEWLQMRTHPQIGGRLLGRPELADLRAWVLAHHERPDGRGYPFALAGDEIPIEARILSVADAFEAMTAERVYKRAMSVEVARAELVAGAGAQFDANVVRIFLAALDDDPDAGLAEEPVTAVAERSPS